MLPLLPGPFGDHMFLITDMLDKSPAAQKQLRFPLRGDRLRRFYADGLLENMLMHGPLAASARAPFTDLYECSDH